MSAAITFRDKDIVAAFRREGEAMGSDPAWLAEQIKTGLAHRDRIVVRFDGDGQLRAWLQYHEQSPPLPVWDGKKVPKAGEFYLYKQNGSAYTVEITRVLNTNGKARVFCRRVTNK